MNFISSSITFKRVPNNFIAYQAGVSLAIFHHLISDIPNNKLRKTIDSFHDLSFYLASYSKALKSYDSPFKKDSIYHIKTQNLFDYISSTTYKAIDFLDFSKLLTIDHRPIHGDPKIDNILFDSISHKSISLIDWDTVQTGTIFHDLADCIRSSSNPGGEEHHLISDIRFDINLFRNTLEGYSSITNNKFTLHEVEYLHKLIFLLPYQLGLRFLTDFMIGDRYFKVNTPFLNLYRAETQFQLSKSISQQNTQIIDILRNTLIVK